MGKVGKVVKGLGVVGSALSIGNNVVEAQKDGWQLHDASDIVTDSAVDIGELLLPPVLEPRQVLYFFHRLEQ